MHRLRAPGGCPWDREQTHSSLVKYLIEESYEVSEAIDAGDDAELVKELGDVLLQVVFHAEIAAEEGRFNIEDILESISGKMIRRHPHVFGDASADDSQAVLRQWEAIKQAERGRDSSFLEGIPNSLPALLKALRLQGRASQVGFDWDHIGQVKAKVHEEFGELEAALEKGDEEAVEEELGDLLFALVNWARYMDTDPEKALQDCNRKFVERFRHIETTLLARGKSLAEADITEMDALWEEAKIILGGRKKP
jgi:MazG family protein